MPKYDFPPAPVSLKGRTTELRALQHRLTDGRIARLALVGGGGSGKSLLACAIGHRLRAHFTGGLVWLRVGNWDTTTLFQMFARKMGANPTGGARGLRRTLGQLGPVLIVLDNHENDAALARFLDELNVPNVVWLITARRCLLSGVEIFAVVPPLVTSAQDAFPRVAPLTKLLRWNPLALDIADALVHTRAVSVRALHSWLLSHGLGQVRVMAHEDDIAEVRGLFEWAWAKLAPASRRQLVVLASSEGDDIDEASLFALARTGKGGEQALGALRRWHLVQEPVTGRFTVHAVIRYAVQTKKQLPGKLYFDHYVPLLERDKERVVQEQTHLYAAMDYAHRNSSLVDALRVQELATLLGA
ncbi:MAG: hypothetical protein SF187_30000 [Deltaproteobacteria bacterium]|nr:hypothetical protein [Deltaproteobacteria bacterium]